MSTTGQRDFGLILFGLLSLIALAQAPAQTKEIDVAPGAGWVDTGIDLKAGDIVRISATGQLRYAKASRPNGPDGLPRAFSDIVHNMPLNDSGRGALLGRFGSEPTDRPFLIGERVEKRAPITARLFLGVNQTPKERAIGKFHVTIARTGAAAARAEAQVLAFPQDLLDMIPRRASSARGIPGDRTNFVVIGSQKQMQGAFKLAGWFTVDRSKKEMVFDSVKDPIEKQAYVTLPMSELRLWNRPQDFGYAQGDPFRVVASRHHFRIWKAPFELGAVTVWVGAGTHDVGIARNPRNELLTHKIDPNVDAEREYIRDSLEQTGAVVKTVYMTPSGPVLKARTATNEEFTSDGRTAIIYLAPEDAAK